MMEEKKEGGMSCGSACGSMGGGCGKCGGMSCGGCRGGHHFLVKKLLMIIILIAVFWAGLKLGELKELVRGYGFYGPDGGIGGYRMMNGWGPGYMMQGFGVSTTTPVAPVK